MKLRYLTPYALDKHIGREYNQQIKDFPDEDWIIIRDGDTCFTTPFWGTQVHDIIQKHGKEYQLIGCVTNRVNNEEQLPYGFSEEEYTHHHKIGAALHQEKYDQVKPAKQIAGLCMIFPKTLWNQIHFDEVYRPYYFDQIFCRMVTAAGYKIGIAEGLYIFHAYRWGNPDPRKNYAHLV